MWVAIHIFSAKNVNVFAIFQDGNFNVTLANNFINFWKIGPWFLPSLTLKITCKIIADNILNFLLRIFQSEIRLDISYELAAL